MNVISQMLKQVCFGILVLSLITIPEMATAQQQTPTADESQQPPPSNNEQTHSDQVPVRQPAAENTTPNPSPQTHSNDLPNSPGSVRPQQPVITEHPIGTAAAEIGNASGIAASKPAGVAIAPAKQHQSRSLLIKVGAILGAGVAIGTVMALSNASPSRPPNSQ